MFLHHCFVRAGDLSSGPLMAVCHGIYVPCATVVSIVLPTRMTLQGNHQDLLEVSHTFMCLVFSAWSDGRCENPVRILCINHNREPVLGLVGRDTALQHPSEGFVAAQKRRGRAIPAVFYATGLSFAGVTRNQSPEIT